MSKASPILKASVLQKFLMRDSHNPAVQSKIKLKHSVVSKIFKASVEKAKGCIRVKKDTEEERLETLMSVEREFVKSLVGIKKVIILGEQKENQRTPERKACKCFRRKKLSIDSWYRARNNSSLRRFDSTCSSPKSEMYSKILF